METLIELKSPNKKTSRLARRKKRKSEQMTKQESNKRNKETHNTQTNKQTNTTRTYVAKTVDAAAIASGALEDRPQLRRQEILTIVQYKFIL